MPSHFSNRFSNSSSNALPTSSRSRAGRAAAGVALATVFAALSSRLPAQSPERLFERALYAETIRGDVDSAVGTYSEILAKEGLSSDLAARTRLRLGLSLRGLGHELEAEEQFRTIVERFPNHGCARWARECLGAANAIEPARYIAPETILYVELSAPALLTELLRESVRGTPVENPVDHLRSTLATHLAESLSGTSAASPGRPDLPPHGRRRRGSYGETSTGSSQRRRVPQQGIPPRVR